MLDRKLTRMMILAVPPLLGAIFIYCYGANLIMFDEFDFVPLVTTDSMPSLGVFFEQHNEHRVFFPAILYRIISRLTSLNTFALLYVSFLFVSSVYFLVVVYAKNILPKKLACLLGLFSGFLLFHPMQYENALWGFQITFYMTLVFSLFAIYLFSVAVSLPDKSTSKYKIYFALSMFAAIIASFSSAQGLLSWAAIVFVWAIQDRTGMFKTKLFYLWAVVTLAVWTLYFHHYAKPTHHPSLMAISTQPFGFVQYFLSFLGSPFRYKTFSQLQGFMVIVMCVYVMVYAFRCRQPKLLFPIGVIIFSLLAGLSISVGRSGFGWKQSLASRYTSFSILAFLGAVICITYLFQVDFFRQRVRTHRIFRVAIPLLVLMLFVRIAQDMKDIDYAHRCKEEARYYMLTFSTQPDSVLEKLRVPPELVRIRAEVLKQLKYNVFSENQ